MLQASVPVSSKETNSNNDDDDGYLPKYKVKCHEHILLNVRYYISTLLIKTLNDTRVIIRAVCTKIRNVKFNYVEGDKVLECQ